MWSNRSPLYLNVWIPWVFSSLIRKLFEPSFFLIIFKFWKKVCRTYPVSRWKHQCSKCNETSLYFTDYFNTWRAVFTGGNVLFPSSAKIKKRRDLRPVLPFIIGLHPLFIPLYCRSSPPTKPCSQTASSIGNHKVNLGLPVFFLHFFFSFL